MSVSRCGRAITEPRFLGSLEGYIVVEPRTEELREVTVRAYARNYGAARRYTIDLEICGDLLERRSVKLETGETAEMEAVAETTKECVARLVVNGQVVDTESVFQLRKYSDETLLISMVFHNHQPPNYGPDGLYIELWPYVYVWGPVLSPYGLGPYHYHAHVLSEPGRSLKVAYNLSPSLIAQWTDIVERGIRTIAGEHVDPSSELAAVVKETLSTYKNLADGAVIEVLTSIYAHTIAGYVVDELGLDDLIRRELEYGISVTKGFTGRDPRGLWLPEMSFSMKLIPLLTSLNLEYTFLDEKYHFRGASGEVGSPYEPYLLRDPATGDGLVVFFRDTELSNDIGFQNNYCSDIHAIKGAYSFALKVLSKALNGEAKVVTLALDGENWMAGSSNPPATAVFFDTLISLLEKLIRLKILEVALPRDLINRVPPKRKLSHVPSTTWLGSYSKWLEETAGQEVFWREVRARVRKFKEYISKHGFDERIKKAEWALWHMLDSDYWWTEFWNQKAISLWIKEFDKYVT